MIQRSKKCPLAVCDDVCVENGIGFSVFIDPSIILALIKPLI